jgi:GGDEF domain-containing protein
VPLVFNLSTCNLIAFNEQLPDTTSKFVSDANVDWSQAEAVERLLIRSDTHLYSYPAFLYVLKSEFSRWERFGRPFAVVLLQMSGSLDPHGIPEPLSIDAVREMADRIGRLKRRTDLFAHYETFGFALLLLETDGQEAHGFANRLVDAITKDPLSGGLSGMRVLAKAGVACIPDDCATLGSMLARAKPAG